MASRNGNTRTPAPLLSASPEQVREAADAMATIRSRQGGPDLSRQQSRPLTVSYDTSAWAKARRLGFLLQGAAPIAHTWRQRSGIDLEWLAGCGEKYEGACDLRSAAELLDGALGDTLGLVQRKGLRMARRLLDQVEARLLALPLSDPRRRRLESLAARMRDKRAALLAALLKRGKKTRQLRADLAARVQTVRKKTELTQALIAIRNGEPVDPKLEAEALDAYLRYRDGDKR